PKKRPGPPKGAHAPPPGPRRRPPPPPPPPPPRPLARQVLQPQLAGGEEDSSTPVAAQRMTAQRPAAADRFIVGVGSDRHNVPGSRHRAARLKLVCLRR